MKILIFTSVAWFLCAFSLLLNAQETYVWNSVGSNYIIPSYYEMYKFDIQTGDRQFLFRIDSTRFLHSNMTGNSFLILSFAISKDKKTIYFLEKEGDVYSYDIGNDVLTYHVDVTPGNVNFLWHNYHQTHQIDQLNDSIYYIGGATKGMLNINNFQFSLIREIPSFASSGTKFELDMYIRKLEKYKDQYIILNGDIYLSKADLNDPVKNIILFNQDLTPLGYFDDTNIISYQYDCDSTILYTLQNKFYMGQRDTIQIDRVDIASGQITRWKNYIGLSSDNFSKNTIRDIQHFNAPTWEDCQRYIDLDKDDNTALLKDFLIDSLCTFESIPLSDLDIHINNEYAIDSIDIFIIDPRFSQYMYFPTGNYILNSPPNPWQRIINNGTTSIQDFEYAIRNAYLDIENDPSVTEVKIGFQVWYNGIVGDTAIATIKIGGPLPFAGQDTLFQFCENNILPEIEILKSSDADSNGLFYNSSFSIINQIPTISVNDSSLLYYIVSNGICKDTVVNILKINPAPSIDAINDATVCYDDIINIQITSSADSILWNDGNKNFIRDISSSGIYQYSIINQYGCASIDTFEVKKLPAPISQNIQIKICKDSIYSFNGTSITDAGMYVDTTKNSLNCDSIFTSLVLDHYEDVPIIISGDTSFCSGSTTTLSLISDHIDVIWNDELMQPSFTSDQEGKIIIYAKDKNGCSSQKEVNIIEHPLPEVLTTDLIDTVFIQDLKLDVNYNNSNLSYQWTPSQNISCNDCPYPFLLQKEDGEFIIKVINEFGCTDSSSIRITFKETILTLPNIITKNPIDPLNGIFFLQGNTTLPYELYIYDRWGNLMYQNNKANSNNEQDGWKPDESLVSGVYVYVIKYVENGVKKVINGDITLVD